jgi:hypothetical protein
LDYGDLVLDLKSFDLEQVATALADQADGLAVTLITLRCTSKQ